MTKTMIAKIDFRHGGEPHVAELDSALRWHCTDSFVLTALQIQFHDYVYSPAHGRWGARLLHEAARFLKGSPTWLVPEGEPAHDGLIVY